MPLRARLVDLAAADPRLLLLPRTRDLEGASLS